ncbi:MAG: hypothetical protein Q7T11_07910 [Deltaproteobacteria bacterium]|nr:hypothetical protein [Deltaproteobacteria bacterium]
MRILFYLLAALFVAGCSGDRIKVPGGEQDPANDRSEPEENDGVLPQNQGIEAGNPDVSGKIKVTPVTVHVDGAEGSGEYFSAKVEIPLAFFGTDESSLEGATIGLMINGISIAAGIRPSDYYDSTTQVVSLSLDTWATTGLANGDQINVTINRNDGTSTVSTILFSSSAESTSN